MRVGVHLAGGSTSASMERISALATRAEALGFDSVWLSDHVVMPAQFASPYPYAGANSFTSASAALYYEPIVTLAWVAGITRRVRLGISVLVVPQRNPLLTAKQLATLDDLSGGRLILGVGSGWLREEFEALHADFDRRGATTDAYLRMYRQLWSGDSTRSTNSPYRHRSIYSRPTPARGRNIPIWVGGHSDRALRRTIELGDGWHATRLDVASFRAASLRLRALAVASGRDVPALSVLCELATPGPHEPEEWRLTGATATTIEKLRRYRDAGCDEVVLGLPHQESTTTVVEAMESFVSEVRPSLD